MRNIILFLLFGGALAAQHSISLSWTASTSTGVTSASAVTLNAAGSGYTASDVLTLADGTGGGGATVTVLTVDGGGAILTWLLTTHGSGYSIESAVPATGGSGSSAAFNITALTQFVVGYNVYRGLASGGPYTKLNSTPVSSSYRDATGLTAGTPYYYVATAVSLDSVESVYSTEVRCNFNFGTQAFLGAFSGSGIIR